MFTDRLWILDSTLDVCGTDRTTISALAVALERHRLRRGGPRSVPLPVPRVPLMTPRPKYLSRGSCDYFTFLLKYARPRERHLNMAVRLPWDKAAT